MKTPLNESRQATFDAVQIDGTAKAVARLSPSVFGLTWNINKLVTSTFTSNTPTAVFLRVYRNVEEPTQMIDSTYSGTGDQSETSVQISGSDVLLFVWIAQTDPGAGSFAVAVVNGEIVNDRR